MAMGLTRLVSNVRPACVKQQGSDVSMLDVGLIRLDDGRSKRVLVVGRLCSI